MRLAVLDTHVIVSAGIKPGSAPAALVHEYQEVIRRPKFRRYGFPPQWLKFLIDESLRLPDPTTWAERGPDPKDLPFLALARMAGAWLVTANVKHFPETFRDGVRVLSSAEYLAHLGEG